MMLAAAGDLGHTHLHLVAVMCNLLLLCAALMPMLMFGSLRVTHGPSLLALHVLQRSDPGRLVNQFD